MSIEEPLQGEERLSAPMPCHSEWFRFHLLCTLDFSVKFHLKGERGLRKVVKSCNGVYSKACA